MKIKEAIFGRRSVRKFKDTPIAYDVLEQLVEAAIYAPSASNKQAWKFIIIDDVAIKKEICEKNGSVVKVGSEIIFNAPSGILVLYKKSVSKNHQLYKDTIQSASAAIENLLLMAYSLGLGTCWICKLPLKKHLRKLLGIPKDYDIVAYIAIGYPQNHLDTHTIRHFDNDPELAEKRPRKYTVKDVISYNSYKEQKECMDTFKYPNMACLLQVFQLGISKNGNGFCYQQLKKILVLLGEKWV